MNVKHINIPLRVNWFHSRGRESVDTSRKRKSSQAPQKALTGQLNLRDTIRLQADAVMRYKRALTSQSSRRNAVWCQGGQPGDCRGIRIEFYVGVFQKESSLRAL